MNLNTPVNEILHHMWLNNPSHEVSQILNLLEEQEEMLFEWKREFEDKSCELIGIEFRELENEVAFLREELDRVKEKCERLEAKTVIDFIDEMSRPFCNLTEHEGEAPCYRYEEQ